MFVSILNSDNQKYNCLFNKMLNTKDPFHKKTNVDCVTRSKCLLTFNICLGAYNDINGP